MFNHVLKVLTVVNLSSLALSNFPHVCDLQSTQRPVYFVCLLKTNKTNKTNSPAWSRRNITSFFIYLLS